MFPNLFLRTFWQTTLRPQVFVAMSFAEIYKQRFEQVIAPAIGGIQVNGVPLQPYRVDLSKSGDSILTDIMDGIAHCQMFLADVSLMGNDSRTGYGYRNGNVLYEVGLAVACRQSTEILLIRDDHDRFLFDVSTIPHLTLDFTKVQAARAELQERLLERLRERDLLNDARVRKTIATLTSEELTVIKHFGSHAPPAAWGFSETGRVNFLAMAAIPRLFDKQLIQLIAKWTTGGGAFQWTPIGYAVAQHVLQRLPAVEAKSVDLNPPPANPPSPNEPGEQKDC